jgi:hypothetical protein
MRVNLSRASLLRIISRNSHGDRIPNRQHDDGDVRYRRILYFCVGLSPTILLITDFSMYHLRRRPQLYSQGDRQGDLDNSFTLPSYVRTDAAIFYRRDNWQANLNFQNLFDVDYIRSSETFREALRPGNPFTVIGSVSVNF